MGNSQKNKENQAKKHQFGAEVSKVLKLMIHSLYTNKDIFLRELISNASDACDKLRYEALTKAELLSDKSELKIIVSVNEAENTLTVSDNGIGMSRAELIANLGTIARSGTQEFVGQLSGDSKKDMPLIGQFGVGFYSSFMVAEKVSVTSHRAGAEKGYIWESDGEGEFTLEEAAGDIARGTSITLTLRDDAKEYLDRFRVKHIVETYSDHIGFPIELEGGEGEESERLNKGSALWTRPKSEISDEQYKEFYHHVAHSPDEPWMTLHQKAEGLIEYTALLFIPDMKPFDLFHPDRKQRVKLYIKRVFITDEGVSLIPAYLRFLRGVVDSQDLPLNISRETLQTSPTLRKIQDAVVKKVLSELKKKADKEPEAYIEFWKNFGSVLKEGLCEPVQNKEPILEVCRFNTNEADDLTGLDDYLGRMKEGQEEIFYLTGERLEALQTSPQLEGFKKRGIEVLLLSDHVDDFWLTVVQEYKGKTFKSVTRADIDLSAFGEDSEEDANKNDEKDMAAKPDQESLEELRSYIRATLGEQVRDVRFSSKLVSHPACLAVEEGAMDIRLERFLVEQKQLPSGSAKIFEVNPLHPIVKQLVDRVKDKKAGEETSDIVWLLFDQARVMEGEEITDPSAFSRRISAFVERSLNAA